MYVRCNKGVIYMVVRLSISLDENLLPKIDKVARDMGLNRSAFLSVAVNQYITQNEAMKMMSDMPALLEKLDELEKKINESNLSKA